MLDMNRAKLRLFWDGGSIFETKSPDGAQKFGKPYIDFDQYIEEKKQVHPR
jgi:hypothetical protein